MKGTNIITLGSMTNAFKARRFLSRAGIKVNIIKTEENKTNNGCSHGIEISQYDFYSAIDILRNAGIEYTVYETR